MKVTLIFLTLAVGIYSQGLKCKLQRATVPDTWLTMVNNCTMKMRHQVGMELTAAMTYLAMGAHFAQDTVNRPGFSELFLNSASEEREHAIKLIEYLLMRGELVDNIGSLINNPTPEKNVWANGLEALNDALKMEARVTTSIREIISECENTKGFNDYHLVDYLTSDFLTEQYKGQRDLAGKIATLSKMMVDSTGVLGDFLFDKKLLNGEV